MTFSWIPFYKELALKLLQFKGNRTPLVNWIYENLDGYINHLKDNPEGKRVSDIDPFTVYSIFNRGITNDKRIDICNKFKIFLKVESPVPHDFDAIPIMNAKQSNFMAFEKDREEGDIDRLWNLFEDAVMDKSIENSYNALAHQYLIRFNITFGLFWIRPDKYLALDGHNQDLMESLGISFDKRKFLPYNEYERVMESLKDKMRNEAHEYSDFAEFSYEAYKQKEGENNKSNKNQNSSSTTYWLYSPGEKASKWPLCTNEGIMCIGWDAMGDLTQYPSREDMRIAVKKHYPTEGSAKNDSFAVWQFANEMKIGDIVIAKKGMSKIIGRGIVESDYMFDANREEFMHIRKVRWTDIGEWDAIGKNAMKTLTNITSYTDYVEKLNNLFVGYDKVEEPIGSPDVNYWWLVASPKIWSVADMKIGEEQYYTLYNEDGHRRRIFQHFLNAKVGDVVVGYESTPRKQVVGLLTISKIKEDEAVYFKKTKDLPPISYSTLRSEQKLVNMEYMKNQQGSFFKVTPEEFEVIMRIARGENTISQQEEKEKYSKADFLNEVFVSEDDFEKLKHLLLRKKNLILQGAPGVGKTYAAKRLAYAIMGEKDEDRVMQVQFHQNYSYEDFVMGYKPNENGGFKLEPGKFYNFCKNAEEDRDHKYFFIIDEINRGNLSKIFGELLMLIESDYRDKPIELSYRKERFSVPSNIYIIGMMNTADRSLAMIDYALRRRFSFFEMKPGFETSGFKAYLRKLNDPCMVYLAKAIIELNKIIAADDSLGSGFCIGHSYLCELEEDYDLESIVEYDIIPMLREYWFDNNERFNLESQKLRDALT